jgi:hypothetical protein
VLLVEEVEAITESGKEMIAALFLFGDLWWQRGLSFLFRLGRDCFSGIKLTSTMGEEMLSSSQAKHLNELSRFAIL